MKKSDEQERNIANRLYNLDKKVYETTGSTLGRVFPSSPSFALEKIIEKRLHMSWQAKMPAVN